MLNLKYFTKLHSSEFSTTSDEDDEEEELCSSPVHIIYKPWIADSNAAFDKPVTMLYSSLVVMKTFNPSGLLLLLQCNIIIYCV